MIYYDVYGFESDDFEVARHIIEEALKIQFEAHDSFYIGDYYRFRRDDGEEFLIKENFDEDLEDYREREFKEFPLLLYIEESTKEKVEKYKAILSNLEGVTFLRRETI